MQCVVGVGYDNVRRMVACTSSVKQRKQERKVLSGKGLFFGEVLRSMRARNLVKVKVSYAVNALHHPL